jgi:hypothetical protein
MAAGQKELDAAAIQNVIQLLEHASRLPGMWLGEVTLLGATHFLTGFNAGLQAFVEIGRVNACQSKVLTDRGYRTPFHQPQEWLEQIQEKFPDELDAARERLTVELEVWKQFRDSTS